MKTINFIFFTIISFQLLFGQNLISVSQLENFIKNSDEQQKLAILQKIQNSLSIKRGEVLVGNNSLSLNLEEFSEESFEKYLMLISKMAVSDDSSRVRNSCIRLLYKSHGNPRVDDILIDVLKKIPLHNQITLLKCYASEVMPQLPKGAKIEFLKILPKLSSEEELWQVAYLIGEFGLQDPEFLKFLQEQKKHPSEKVRRYSSKALEKLSHNSVPKQ